MISYAREGITIDLVARALRKTALNPRVMVPISAILHWGITATKVHPIQSLAYACASLGTALAMNDWLNTWSANNWDGGGRSAWDWVKEIVVVTGGSSGIGAGIAQELLARNPRTTIVIVDYAPMAWTPDPGASVSYYKCDLSDAAAIRALAARIRADVGHPTVLVNNAGLCRGASVMEGSYGDVGLTVRTNLIAPFLLAKEVLPHMARTNHGPIVNVGSVSSLFPPANVADYSATKAGITAFHEVCVARRRGDHSSSPLAFVEVYLQWLDKTNSRKALQLELKHVHHAPRVRLTLGILGFINTPLFKGETRQSHFLFPLLHTDTAAETVVDALYSGLGRTFYLPGIMRYAAMLVSRRGGTPESVFRMC